MEELVGLHHKYDNFKQCYETFGEIIQLQEQSQLDSTLSPIMQSLISAGVIKHFEITYETAWKFLKEYLEYKYDCEALSPKQIFRECEKYRIFPQRMVNDLITLSDARNTTTHIYNRILAQEVCDAVMKHYAVLGQILKIIPRESENL